ncbi:lipoyl(octanoyl) transferase LipB [bacterium]|nr:lipoyl(octanoyl) transferase LipB [bacterium]
MLEHLNILSLGLKDYQETYKIQKELVKQRAAGQIPDTLLLVEHPPVFTIGRNGGRENILVSSIKLEKEGIKVHEIDRGGDITYHGPGQIVGYPIIDLKNYGKDIHLYLRMLEEVIIKLLEKFNIKAKRIKGMTGVWVRPVRDRSPFGDRTSRSNIGVSSNGVDDKKIASIGIRVSKWVTCHGFALNVDPNIKHFAMINPCGLGKSMTSMKEQLNGRCPEREKIEEILVECFRKIFSG